MYKVNSLIMASMLALSTTSVLAADEKNPATTNCSETKTCIHSDSKAKTHANEKHRMMRQRGLFDSLDLTAQQRQQMRDLIRQDHHDTMPKLSLNNMDEMHKLVTADQFDENAARAQAEKLAKAQVERQIALAKINHQFYSLLTPEQKIAFNQNHSERMAMMQQHLEQMPQHEEPNLQ
ncbi:MAG: Spy/CpxP family protein refolding chaperone [Enterobacteriaceae bacterium]|nr:Spy/CpxP family protein refolding chaperone [Enterobacteriaceae bacterium]